MHVPARLKEKNIQDAPHLPIAVGRNDGKLAPSATKNQGTRLLARCPVASLLCNYSNSQTPSRATQHPLAETAKLKRRFRGCTKN
mmetsp:Transcript_67161/g.146439  ORF Transcript_67161/g.146439 Transcript_67161/m.146439 type:complete len:85 (-) Transcript_67161:2754-3008(-)